MRTIANIAQSFLRRSLSNEKDRKGTLDHIKVTGNLDPKFFLAAVVGNGKAYSVAKISPELHILEGILGAKGVGIYPEPT